MQKNNKCNLCKSIKYYAKGLCQSCYDKNKRKKGVCRECGNGTYRPSCTLCQACSNRLFPRHAIPHTKESREKMRQNNWRAHNEIHPQWKGDNVGYYALHRWIRRHKGVPSACEKCGKTGRLDASNKDHKYTRNLDDWQFLCQKCHKEYDLANGLYSLSGEKHPFFGKHHSDETRTKISETLKQKGIKPTVLPSREQCIKNLRGRNN